MRILMITDSYRPTTDGVVTTVVTTRKELTEMGHEVFVIAPDPGKEYREPDVIYFPAIRFRKYDGYYLPIFRSNKIEIIDRIKPDIIHIYGVALMALKALIAAHTLRIPTVMTYITMVDEAISAYSPIKLPPDILGKLAWIYLRNFVKRPSAVIVPTEPIAEELGTRNVVTKRLEVIHIGVDTSKFIRVPEKGLEIRERHGLTDKKVLICAGRLSAEKNIDMLIRSVGLLDDDTRLMIVGKGPMEQHLKQLTADLGLNDRVIFTGFVPHEELIWYYSAADITVSCSKFETQGLTTLEAMSCELPAACCNGRAFKEVIRNGENGQLFGDTEEECASAINYCLSDLHKLSRGARATAERYSMKRTAELLESLYLDVLNKNSN